MIGLLLQTTRLFVQSAPPIAAARVALVSIASASMWFVLAQKCKSVPLSLAENFGFSNYSFFLFSCAPSQWMAVLFPEIFIFRCCRRRFARCRGSETSSKPWTACNILGRAYNICTQKHPFSPSLYFTVKIAKVARIALDIETTPIRMEIWYANYTPNPSPTTPNDAFHSAKPPPPKISNRPRSRMLKKGEQEPAEYLAAFCTYPTDTTGRMYVSSSRLVIADMAH
jgi:hypothetical protein